jgi:hypothetical protein
MYDTRTTRREDIKLIAENNIINNSVSLAFEHSISNMATLSQ